LKGLNETAIAVLRSELTASGGKVRRVFLYIRELEKIYAFLLCYRAIYSLSKDKDID
jgi:hypothetical protein